MGMGLVLGVVFLHPLLHVGKPGLPFGGLLPLLAGRYPRFLRGRVGYVVMRYHQRPQPGQCFGLVGAHMKLRGGGFSKAVGPRNAPGYGGIFQLLG